MQVTDVRVRLIHTTGKMRAVASVTFDDMFVVHDMRIVEGDRGLFLAMPSRRAPSGEYRDIAHPMTSEARAMIQDAVLKAYEECLAQPQAPPAGQSVVAAG